MSTLTKKEREALEEVFLSIKHSGSGFKKLKRYFLDIGKNKNKNMKTEYFRDIFKLFFGFFVKDKKNLSK